MNNINESIISKYLEISSKMLEESFVKNDGENVIVSPFSLLMMLALVLNATSGVTQNEIKEAILNDYSVEDITNILVDLQKNLSQKKKGSKLSSANGICVDADLFDGILSDFKKLTQKMFEGEIFAGKDNMPELINKWIKKNTDGLISELSVPEDMKLCIMNAIAFSAKWKVPYEPDDIKDDFDYFCNCDGTESEAVYLMSSEDGYIENEVFEGFIKPYKGDKYEFMCLLPKKEEAIIPDYLAQIDFRKLYESNNLRYTTHATIPEFESETDTVLNDFCRKLGINKIFDPDAEFDGMFGNNHEPLMVDSVLQKAYIKVDSSGTKAAVVSAACACPGAAPEFDETEKFVYLTRPFVYAIMNKEYKIPVFAGVVNRILE